MSELCLEFRTDQPQFVLPTQSTLSAPMPETCSGRSRRRRRVGQSSDVNGGGFAPLVYQESSLIDCLNVHRDALDGNPAGNTADYGWPARSRDAMVGNSSDCETLRR